MVVKDDGGRGSGVMVTGTMMGMLITTRAVKMTAITMVYSEE